MLRIKLDKHVGKHADTYEVSAVEGHVRNAFGAQLPVGGPWDWDLGEVCVPADLFVCCAGLRHFWRLPRRYPNTVWFDLLTVTNPRNQPEGDGWSLCRLDAEQVVLAGGDCAVALPWAAWRLLSSHPFRGRSWVRLWYQEG